MDQVVHGKGAQFPVEEGDLGFNDSHDGFIGRNAILFVLLFRSAIEILRAR
jgi:hypothetical protein